MPNDHKATAETDHAPGDVKWPGSADLMDQWVQAALDDPRPGDVFHETYSVGVQVMAVDLQGVHWRSFNTRTVDTGVKSREEWRESFRYSSGIPGHTMHLMTRGDVVQPPGEGTS